MLKVFRKLLRSVNFLGSRTSRDVPLTLQGVYKRALSGQASADNAEALGSLATHVAQCGMDFAKKHSLKPNTTMGAPRRQMHSASNGTSMFLSFGCRAV